MEYEWCVLSRSIRAVRLESELADTTHKNWENCQAYSLGQSSTSSRQDGMKGRKAGSSPVPRKVPSWLSFHPLHQRALLSSPLPYVEFPVSDPVIKLWASCVPDFFFFLFLIIHCFFDKYTHSRTKILPSYQTLFYSSPNQKSSHCMGLLFANSFVCFQDLWGCNSLGD